MSERGNFAHPKIASHWLRFAQLPPPDGGRNAQTRYRWCQRPVLQSGGSCSSASGTQLPREQPTRVAEGATAAYAKRRFRNRRRAIRQFHRATLHVISPLRQEERRVGKECVCTCRSGWSPSHLKKTINRKT